MLEDSSGALLSLQSCREKERIDTCHVHVGVDDQTYVDMSNHDNRFLSAIF